MNSQTAVGIWPVLGPDIGPGFMFRELRCWCGFLLVRIYIGPDFQNDEKSDPNQNSIKFGPAVHVFGLFKDLTSREQVKSILRFLDRVINGDISASGNFDSIVVL